MPHGKCRKGKEQRKKPGHEYKPLKHLAARENQQKLASALTGKDEVADKPETMCIDGKNAATHRPVRDAVESA